MKFKVKEQSQRQIQLCAQFVYWKQKGVIAGVAEFLFKGLRKLVAYVNTGFKYGFEVTKGKVFNYENYLKL